MRTERWWSVILTVGLFMALNPLSAQAGPNGTFAPQPKRQAFTQPQPRNFANGYNSQPHQWQQPRGNANGWNGQPHQWQQHPGNAYGWNAQNRQWQHPRGNAYGWNDHQRQWNQHQNSYGWNNHQRQWDQHRNAYGQNDHRGQWDQQRNAYGGNDHQRQGQQPHPSFTQGDRPENRQFQPTNGGQHNNPGSSYNHAGYPAQAQSPTIVPRPSGYSPSTTIPAGQTGAQPGFHRPDASGNAPQPQNPSPSGVI